MVYIIKSIPLLRAIEREVEQAHKSVEQAKEIQRKLESLNTGGIIYAKKDDALEYLQRARQEPMIDFTTIKEYLSQSRFTAFDFSTGRERKY